MSSMCCLGILLNTPGQILSQRYLPEMSTGNVKEFQVLFCVNVIAVLFVSVISLKCTRPINTSIRRGLKRVFF